MFDDPDLSDQVEKILHPEHFKEKKVDSVQKKTKTVPDI